MAYYLQQTDGVVFGNNFVQARFEMNISVSSQKSGFFRDSQRFQEKHKFSFHLLYINEMRFYVFLENVVNF